MNKKTLYLAVVAGLAVGALLVWRYLKERREDSFVEPQETPKDKTAERKPYIRSNYQKPDIMEYAKKVRNQGYTNYSNKYTNNPPDEDEGDEEEYDEEEYGEEIYRGEPTDEASKPYVIPPDNFGEIEGYEQISLIWYADSILANQSNEIIENVEDIIGFESLGTFGKYEDDSVYVQNDILKCYFEILRDNSRYKDLMKKGKQHSVEEE